MKKKALGLGDMAIPWLDYANREGLQQDDLEKYDRFFGGKDIDDSNENVHPAISKRHIHPEDAAYEGDEVAKKYFDYLLKMQRNKKNKQG